MSEFPKIMRLKEMAEEDIYFARHDRELIEALHRKHEEGDRGTRAMIALKKVVSGGQTGVDRAALDVALVLGIPVGGWCPRGRRALDGPLPERYPLEETPSADYPQRTEWNVRDSDGTLILHRGPLSGGTRYTVEMASQHDRPLLQVDLDSPAEPATLWRWLAEKRIGILNVAGPREENAPGIYLQAKAYLLSILTPLAAPSGYNDKGKS